MNEVGSPSPGRSPDRKLAYAGDPHAVSSPISGWAGRDFEAELERTSANSAALVNRTHRVVRERAITMQARRSRVRSLYAPLALSAVLVATVVFALWSVLDPYDLAADALPETSQQMAVLTMWCLPVTFVILAVVWFRRAGETAETHIQQTAFSNDIRGAR